MYRYESHKDQIMGRLKRIEGQIKGVMRMVEDGRYCPDILQQLAALDGALDEVGLLLLEDHVKGCVTDAIQENQGDDAIHELVDVIRKVVRR